MRDKRLFNEGIREKIFYNSHTSQVPRRNVPRTLPKLVLWKRGIILEDEIEHEMSSGQELFEKVINASILRLEIIPSKL